MAFSLHVNLQSSKLNLFLMDFHYVHTCHFWKNLKRSNHPLVKASNNLHATWVQLESLSPYSLNTECKSLLSTEVCKSLVLSVCAFHSEEISQEKDQVIKSLYSTLTAEMYCRRQTWSTHHCLSSNCNWVGPVSKQPESLWLVFIQKSF